MAGDTPGGGLPVSKPGDSVEREAERVADEVMGFSDSTVAVRTQGRVGPDGHARMCSRCQRRHRRGKPLHCDECETHMRRSTDAEPAGSGVAATERAARALAGRGRPLPSSVRADFEPRFGRAFGDVRVHTDSAADEAARAIDARAFTDGRDIAFRSGEYDPGSHSGRRLLAHELAHVVQQDAATARPTRIHRQETEETGSEPDRPQPESTATEVSSRERTDVALLLSSGADEAAKAVTVSPDARQLRVTSAEDMASKLSDLSEPIGRLLVFSHSLPSGDLGFETGSTTTFVQPTDVASALADAVPPELAPTVVDFRGCSLGTSPAGMEQIRAALNADAAIAGNCFIVSQVQGPVTLSDGEDGATPITSPDQLTEETRDPFEAGLEMLREAFGPARACLLDDSADAYFRAGGRLVAMWANPGFSTEWDERKSRCYDDLPTKPVDPETAGKQGPGLAGNCELIRIEAPSERPATEGSAPDSE